MLIAARSIIWCRWSGCAVHAQLHTQDTTHLMRFVCFDPKTTDKRIDFNAKICMIIRKENVFVTLCSGKCVRPANKHQLPHMSETWCVMKTQITFYTSLLGKCPISSELWNIYADMFSKRRDIRSGTQASCSQERCPWCGGVFVVIGKCATTKNVFGALFFT